ncbi:MULTISPECIES: hypothetical protein [unclassified Curtobacterium]|uniref:hypothetical protein n=1 Tax=unclassified Curtobacterium TaxID=257496 RepID=UPI000DB2F634|nr:MULTISPECIES: hypothetical protein [unclassified Curtobacterium]PZO60011.1 MAG: hypothetical protein DI639_04245 [Leifsonia xyli]MBF4588079.1 hypothetical protein [Curtobacterium sp. VKM Ac-2887]MBF4607471.1 hypothetical protein [Curtobacterium sp. VKM Ac-1393]ROR28776.1 hypothetical protein EDF63_3363 [Curtobacterium sp. JUb34]ROS47257.1 hypothetical protein EDF53_0277 [Curtobacterium sp. PhB78]
MTSQSTRVLHVMCTVFLLGAFLSVGIGGWSLANDTGGGANIGGGILMLFGYLLGLIGIALGVATLVVDTVSRRRSRTRS